MGDDYNLRPLWDAILEIYKAFSQVCDRNGLRYCVTGGTALGAMRHGGFIPWDDDFDIIMPREDYVRFFTRHCMELPDYFKAEDFRTPEPRLWKQTLPFGKVFETRSSIVSAIMSESSLLLEQGIFIDIFPIDGMPKNRLMFELWYKWWRIMRFLSDERNEDNWKKKLQGWCRRLLGLKDTSACMLMVERWRRRWNFDNSQAAEDIGGDAYQRLSKRYFDKDVYFPVRLVPFDGISVPVPNKTEYFLDKIFGTWRSLPPISKRLPSHQRLNAIHR